MLIFKISKSYSVSPGRKKYILEWFAMQTFANLFRINSNITGTAKHLLLYYTDHVVSERIVDGAVKRADRLVFAGGPAKDVMVDALQDLMVMCQ